MGQATGGYPPGGRVPGPIGEATAWGGAHMEEASVNLIAAARAQRILLTFLGRPWAACWPACCQSCPYLFLWDKEAV